VSASGIAVGATRPTPLPIAENHLAPRLGPILDAICEVAEIIVD